MNIDAHEIDKTSDINKQYNDSLSIINEKDKQLLDSFYINSNHVIVRPYRLHEEKKQSGIIIATDRYNTISENSGKDKLEILKNAFQYKGVIVKVGKEVKNKDLQVGTVISFMRFDWNAIKFFVDDNLTYIGEDIFHVKVNESQIEKIFK